MNKSTVIRSLLTAEGKPLAACVHEVPKAEKDVSRWRCSMRRVRCGKALPMFCPHPGVDLASVRVTRTRPPERGAGGVGDLSGLLRPLHCIHPDTVHLDLPTLHLW